MHNRCQRIYRFQSWANTSSISVREIRHRTTDFVVAEIDNPSQAELEEVGINIESLEEKRVERLIERVGLHRKPSFADLSALVLAEYQQVVLITGDSDLRSAANELEIEVHGTIWLMDQCLGNGQLSRQTACSALTHMLENNRRLPQLAVRKRLADWGAEEVRT